MFWTASEVAGLNQRQKTIKMNQRNKIQSLVSPTDDPGDAQYCITEYGPCFCEYGRMCHTAPTAQKCGFSVEPVLDLAFLVWPKPSKSMPAAKYGHQRENRRKNTGGPKKRRNYFFLRKFAIFQSLIRGAGHLQNTPGTPVLDFPLVAAGCQSVLYCMPQ